MIEVLAKDVPIGRFFATADPPPANVFVMRVVPRVRFIGKTLKGQKRRRDMASGLCQNIQDGRYWHIQGNRLVNLIGEHEHERTIFHT